MRPDFRILADSADVTAAIRDRLLELSVTDEAGTTSDTVKIDLDDRDGAVAIPRKGAELEISLGYVESGLAWFGRYVVDEVALESPPARLSVSGKAADMQKSLKAPKTRAWHNVTIGSLVGAIAAEHGYRPAVAGEFSGVLLPHLDQTEESDLNLLTRLATERGALTKPAGGFLLFAVPGAGKSLTGKDLPVVDVAGSALSQVRVVLADRGKYPTVVANWYDTAAAAVVPVQAGGGSGPVYTIRNQYPDAVAARAAAESRLAAFERGKATISATLSGDSRLAAEGRLVIAGVRDGIDGEWLVTRVRHVLSRSGYTTEVEGETP